MRKLAVLIIPILLEGCVYRPVGPAVEAPSVPTTADYWQSDLCRGCHDRIVDQHSESMHAKSFTNPAFQAQYFLELVPRVSGNPDLEWEAEKCIACHSPIAFTTRKGLVTTTEQVDPLMAGVTCDFCHTIPGYSGEKPENANYISEPGDQKLGPFQHEYDWHHIYSEFITTSEFCAVCHNFTNHHGLEVRSTFSEWKASRYADEGIQCQDCHMNFDGFLTGGRPFYEAGQAASMPTIGHAPYREKLYTHRFPGAHSKSQVIGALTLDIETDQSTVSPGGEIEIRVLVDNSRTGHRMPTGSPELRLMWLNLEARYQEKVVSVPVTSAESASGCDVSGHSGCEGITLRDDIPAESRVYRAIYTDPSGRPTLSSYHAANLAFDNRLNAAEVRKESYQFVIPTDAEGIISLTARLNYLSYPRAFAESLGIPAPPSVEIAASKKELFVR